ncbi:MAG: SoxR reducing system RseC family protein [Calditrichia bacterium]
MIRMGREIGKINRIKDGLMTVQLQNGKQCNTCSSKSACFFGGPAAGYRYIRIPSVSGYEEGNVISVDYRESSKIVAALVLFFLPIVLLLAGYFAGDAFIAGAGGGILGALAGFMVSLAAIYVLNRVLSRSRLFLPKAAGRVKSGDLSGSVFGH